MVGLFGQRGNDWKSQENARFSLSFSPLSTSGSFTRLADKLCRQAVKLEAKLNLTGLSDHNDLQLVVAYYKL